MLSKVKAIYIEGDKEVYTIDFSYKFQSAPNACQLALPIRRPMFSSARLSIVDFCMKAKGWR
ncbi:hypothetical protein CHH52_08895 [Shouchella clausii]|nr:hypothetical protein CHH52_08895 [Shouchella clausii]